MRYIVISSFKDSTDNDYEYAVGDIFPRTDKIVEEISKERIEELSTNKNKKKRQCIRLIEENEIVLNSEEKVSDGKEIVLDSKEKVSDGKEIVLDSEEKVSDNKENEDTEEKGNEKGTKNKK